MARLAKVIALGMIAGLLTSAHAITLYEDDFSSLALDNYLLWGQNSGDVEIFESNPPEHGPQVLWLPELPHADDTLALIRGLAVTDGIVEMLWSDADLPEDADGPLFVRGWLDDGDPADPALDVKAIFDNSYLVELDTDTGLHITIRTAGAENTPDNFKGVDKSSVDWTWIKMEFAGPNLRLKSWLAADAEPAAWAIDVVDETWTDPGMIGFRAWSGSAEIAYVRVTDLDGPGELAVDPAGKLTTSWGQMKAQR